ncbi:hypothetical protein SADUNF_SadunfUnG0002000 [Salix dunnii]|uniref:Uncharacterized protein n=1 Tax=Salix dunnii TaxID=1413687 RepID=A0A835J0D1_9ROSI|nr:hypothetical protein SADUNF_SadunfUnG0002000 [Salix dunnii]
MSSLEAANKVVMKWLEPKNEQDQKRKKTIDDLCKQIDEMKRQHDKQVDEMKKQFDYDNHVLYQRYYNAAKELVIFRRAYYDLMEKVQQQNNPSSSCQLSPEIEYRKKNISVHGGPVTPSPSPSPLPQLIVIDDDEDVHVAKVEFSVR